MARHRTPGEDPGPAGGGAERPERHTHGTPWPRDADAPRTPGQPQTDRLRYLDAATRRIAAGMDLDETLRELDAAAVPAFADAIFVHLHDPLLTGEGVEGPDAADDVVLHLHPTRRRAPEGPSPGLPSPDAEAAAPEPPQIALRCVNRPAPQGVSECVRLSTTGRLTRLLREGRPCFGDAPGIAPAARELLGPVVGPPGTLPPGRRLIIAPLHGRNRLMGTLALLRRPERAPFTADDLLVASQLATHTALGAHKALMYGHEASVADALQRTMLPASLPAPTGVRLASRYLPASETARVGGDWYDAIPLPGSRVALVVGDVMGHSMTSAAIMGQLRTSVQALAGLDLPPDEVLHHLDDQAQRLGIEHIATCLYAVYDPISHRLLIANAGHPPPVLLLPGGKGEVLPVPAGAPIGVGGVDFETVEMPAPTGATLFLYTDGLVESRGHDIWTGVENLLARVQTPGRDLVPPPLEALCDQALGDLGPGGSRDDDIALLAARFDGFPTHSVAYWYLAPQPETACRARRLTRRALHRWGLDPMLETTELLVSEVVTNAVRLASRPITLRLLCTDVLRCEVGDDSSLVPRLRRAGPEDETGRGLYVVDRLAAHWGARRLGTGKVVWFELPIPDEVRRRGATPA
ncbi:SpoIIE family protein phosphatase [Actinacidiphila glaucinigra]|uniref:SpoIIE family protein phosphatase n=1 Tax=Actinacidiphila glaucinigra TaxID=235986 RepID=UPI0036CF38A0